MTDRTDRTSCGTTAMPTVMATSRPWSPPLGIAVDQARNTLNHIHHTSETTGHNGTVWHLHGTATTLRLLADAARADGQHPDALTDAEQLLAQVDRAGYTVELRDAGHLLADTVTTMRALLDQLADKNNTGWEHHPAAAVAA